MLSMGEMIAELVYNLLYTTATRLVSSYYVIVLSYQLMYRPQYDLDGPSRQMMMGPMQGMPSEASYHPQRSSMMMGQGGYGHVPPLNHHYSNPNYNRGYVRSGPSMHPGSGLSTVMPSKTAMAMGSGVNHSYMTGTNPSMQSQNYNMSGHYATHPHQLSQTPQNTMVPNYHGSLPQTQQSSMMSGYHGAQPGMGGAHPGNQYSMVRNSLYPSPSQQMGLSQPMGYPSHQQQHTRLSMNPALSHMVSKPAMDNPRMPISSHLPGIKSENPQMSSGLSSSVSTHPPIGMSHETHQPPSNTQLYQQYNIQSVPTPIPDESEYMKKTKEIVSTFEAYRAQNKTDSELVKKVNSLLPLLKPKQEGLRDILQECEHLCKQIRSSELSTADTSLNQTTLNFFSDNKFPDNRLPSEFTLEIPVSRTEHFLQFEIGYLDPRIFSVDKLSSASNLCFSFKLECNLKRDGLPAVPPLIVIIPADYPCSSPESDLSELYDATPFLREVKKRFVEDMVSVGGEYTLSHLLTCWDRVVRTTCLTM